MIAALALALAIPTALAATGSYQISPAAHPDLCIATWNSTNGGAVTLANCTDPSTVWKYSDTTHKLRNSNSTQCLDVKGGRKQNGTETHAWGCDDCNRAHNQFFNFTRAITAPNATNATHTIQWGSSEFCLDLKDGVATPEEAAARNASVSVQLWHCLENNTNQLWNVAGVIDLDDASFLYAQAQAALQVN